MTPNSIGYRMPAEWEPHEATWLGWPHERSDWPGKFAAIPWVYGEIVRALAPGEKLRILTHSADVEARAVRVLQKIGVDSTTVEFWRKATNRGWVRDTGPIFVVRHTSGERLAVCRFRFNAWARYDSFQRDAKISSHVAERLGLPQFRARCLSRDVVLEGGAIDVNGCGTILTTEECLLDPTVQVRNPNWTREMYRDLFTDYLGASNVIWLGRGIAGDDTHGHVDDVCRFVNASTVVLCRTHDASDPNYHPLEENAERLQGARLENGQNLGVVALPMPQPLVFAGRRLPASYANFYVGNAAVLVPTFNDPNDRIALGILSELFPTRTVVGIHAVDLAWGLGTIHCLTQQQPLAPSQPPDGCTILGRDERES